MIEEKMRTLGFYQPFATLMLYGKVETRWRNRRGKHPFKLGRYLIYATMKKYKLLEACEIMGPEFEDGWNKYINDATFSLDHTDHGWAIAVGELVSVFKIETPGMNVDTFVQHWEDEEGIRVLYGLRFKDVKRIKPFPFKGKQGIGFVTADQMAQIEYIL